MKKKLTKQEIGLLLIGISGLAMLIHNSLLEEPNVFITILIAIGAVTGLILFATKKK